MQERGLHDLRHHFRSGAVQPLRSLLNLAVVGVILFLPLYALGLLTRQAELYERCEPKALPQVHTSLAGIP